MAGGDIIWHRCDGCGVTSSYPAVLIGSRVKCPNPACPQLLTLPGPDLPLADPVATDEPPRRPSLPTGYADLKPSRGRRGIKWNGQTNTWFHNMQEWSTTTVTVKEKASDRDRAADLLVVELGLMGGGVKLSRPVYRERAAGGRCVRAETSIDGTYDVVADIEVGARYDALTITVRRYWENPKNSTGRALLVGLGLGVFPGPALVVGGHSLLKDAFPDPAYQEMSLFGMLTGTILTGAVFGARAAYLFVRDLFRANRLAAADQNSTAFRHRIDQAIQAVLDRGGLGVPDYLVQRS